MSPGPAADTHLLIDAIIASSDDAMISEDFSGTITSWNPAAARMFGYQESEAVGQSSRLIVPENLQPREEQALRRVCSGAGVDRHETVRRHRDGRSLDVSVTVAPIVASNGTIVGASTIVHDLTATRRLERDARHFAAIADSSDDAIVSKTLDGTIVSWNGAAERLFGYPAGEVIGQSIRLIVPPDRQSEEDRVLASVGRGEVVERFETVRVRKDGSLVPIALTVSPIRTESGDVIGASKIARDLTRSDRVQRDARHFAAIVDSSDDAIISKTLDGTIVSWNRAAERLFGFSSDEMVGRSIRNIIPADRQQEEDGVLARIRAGQRVEHFETMRLHKSGRLVPVSLTVSPIRSADGTVVGASKIARDISDRRRAEEERQRLLDIARDASRVKDEFLATLSHELRTPLNAIVGYVRMMQAGLLNGEKQSRAIDTVVRNAASLTQIVEDVLDVSRIISGKLRLNVQTVELSEIIREAVDTTRPAADAKGILLETTIDPDAGPVSGDPERLRQILWNLCSNAVKFTERGGRVQVRLEQTGSHVSVTVHDTGMGIPAEFLPHLFERFRQADAGMDRAHGGLGLGLAICRHLVELQGGRIFAASEGAGKGSTFRVEFPLKGVQAPGGSQPVGHLQAPSGSHRIDVPALHGVRILVVDDERDALAMVREILEATGATVATADSGQAALDMLPRTRSDLLIVDLGMPHMSGFDLLERVRQLDDPHLRGIPAAALTAFARSEDRARALRGGFELHLSKPIDPGELMTAAAALARRAALNP